MAELAQSISESVKVDTSLVADGNVNKEDEKKEDDIDNVNVLDETHIAGGIAAVEISVENIATAASFLIGVLNFRSEKIHLSLPGSRNGVNIVLAQACSSEEG